MHLMGARVAASGGVAELAARQHGIVTTKQLNDHGVGRRAIAARERAGHLHRVHQGVYAVGHPGLSREQRWMAAVLACLGYRGRSPGEAFLSHRSAAALWQMLPAIAGPVDVAIVGEAGRARHLGIRVHRPRTLEASMTATVNGIPVTDPARTLVDLGRARPSRGGATPGQVRQARRQASFLGLPLGPGRPDPTRSELEQMFLDLCRRYQLPKPEVNMKIATLTVDFLWRDTRLVVETDGYRAHGSEVAFMDDKRRDLRLRALGYDVAHLSHDQVANEAKTVAETLRGLLAAT
jgi:very-short-patch-repair endonuclease